MRQDGNDGLIGYHTNWKERTDTLRWLKDHCATPHEYDFWYTFYDDLEDCFDDIEPWRIYGNGFIENERREMRGERPLIFAAVGDRYLYFEDSIRDHE